MNEVELLFTEVLNYERYKLYLNEDLILNRNQRYIISKALRKRIEGEPIQYILGKAEFMGLDFRVNKDIFIPRPETEILVEIAIRFINLYLSPPASRHILDIGTGSGCIAISLAKFLSNVTITATDISEKTLEIARHNALINNVSEKVRFIRSNLFTQYAIRNSQYDLIVSNPPYIPTAEINKLQPEVKHEPCIALDGGNDGLNFYRRIVMEAPSYLKVDGFLIMEMGFNQTGKVKNIFQNSQNFEIIDIVKDYNNINRVIVGKKKS